MSHTGVHLTDEILLDVLIGNRTNRYSHRFCPLSEPVVHRCQPSCYLYHPLRDRIVVKVGVGNGEVVEYMKV